MYRITLSRLLFFVRLAIVVSLAGYSVASVSSAMHGSSFPKVDMASSEVTPYSNHDVAGASDHAHDAADQNDGLSKIAKQECCKDFCSGFGIVCDSPDVGGPIATSLRQFVDDQPTIGVLPALHRPPNI